MSLEIEVGPPHLAIHQGHTVLVSEPDGQIKRPSTKGLYFFDTRLVSFGPSAPTAGPWDLLSSETTTSSTARICLANCSLVTEEGPIAAHTIGLVVDRQIGGGCANISR
jgi:hypothetical protein